MSQLARAQQHQPYYTYFDPLLLHFYKAVTPTTFIHTHVKTPQQEAFSLSSVHGIKDPSLQEVLTNTAASANLTEQ